MFSDEAIQKFQRSDRPKTLAVWLGEAPGCPDYFVAEGNGYTIETLLGDPSNPASQGSAEQIDFRNADESYHLLYNQTPADKYCLYHNGSDYGLWILEYDGH